MRERIRCVRGDLTLEQVDAIVNAANESLRGGGGVDGAIHRRAGPGLLAECIERYPEGCPTGEARITGGHELAAQHVIHTVGPIWCGGGEGEPELLAACHANSLALAAQHGLKSVSSPAISCGVYGYPAKQEAGIAVRELLAGLVRHETIETVRLVLFSDELLETFRAALAELR